MKKIMDRLFTTLSKEQIEDLTKEVKETIDFDYSHEKSRVFTAADLWNIQRQSRKRVQRRCSF